MRRPAASLGLFSSIVFTLSLGTLRTPAPVSISGPRTVLVGETVELVASGAPAGGRYRWWIEPASPRALGNRTGLLNTRVKGVARGERLEVRGLAPSLRRDDVRVVVDYQASGATSRATWTLTCTAGELTAHRPRNGPGYAPFTRTAVDDADEQSPTLGPGIRINGDLDPGAEDDLIEVVVDVAPASASYVLRRGTGDLAVWTTPGKTPGTRLAFTNGETAPFAPSASPGAGLTLWVEWTGSGHGLADLELRPAGSSTAADVLRFHTFRSIVMALGGENQVPSIPVSSNHGTFLVAIDLYGLGYDVHMHDEDDVASNGAGPVYDEVVRAVQTRGVDEVVIYGYSHGGGSTYDLSERLDANRAGIGTFTIPYTSYVDGIENDSNIDTDPEVRLPPTSAYHVNHYQNGTLADLFLDGGPIPGSNPPPTGLDVETTIWGANATHYIVDDYDQVRDLIRDDLIPRVNR